MGGSDSETFITILQLRGCKHAAVCVASEVRNGPALPDGQQTLGTGLDHAYNESEARVEVVAGAPGHWSLEPWKLGPLPTYLPCSC